MKVHWGNIWRISRPWNVFSVKMCQVLAFISGAQLTVRRTNFVAIPIERLTAAVQPCARLTNSLDPSTLQWAGLEQVLGQNDVRRSD